METRVDTNNQNYKRHGQYRVMQSPKDGLWYVIGYCGEGYWMPTSEGYHSSIEAYSRMRMQPRIDRDAIQLISQI